MSDPRSSASFEDLPHLIEMSVPTLFPHWIVSSLGTEIAGLSLFLSPINKYWLSPFMGQTLWTHGPDMAPLSWASGLMPCYLALQSEFLVQTLLSK